ncbi:hypothetical protein FJZ31_39405 [Candidatus Poribacteria bacterium]|nr:hypothetical protein [Candidatus Poribacteria bacterium]
MAEQHVTWIGLDAGNQVALSLVSTLKARQAARQQKAASPRASEFEPNLISRGHHRRLLDLYCTTLYQKWARECHV